MKKLLVIALALTSVSAFAFPGTTWHSRGETLMKVGKLANLGKFETKQAAVDAAVELAADLSSGDLSEGAKRKLRNGITLWDSDNKCQSYGAINMRIVEREMARGKFSVIKINVNSYYTGSGQEVFTSHMKYYAPCVLKERD